MKDNTKEREEGKERKKIQCLCAACKREPTMQKGEEQGVTTHRYLPRANEHCTASPIKCEQQHSPHSQLCSSEAL